MFFLNICMYNFFSTKRRNFLWISQMYTFFLRIKYEFDFKINLLDYLKL